MFSTFIKLDGHDLIIRAVDLRRLEDTPDGTLIVWDECGVGARAKIEGTAQENLNRLKAEEIAALAQQQRMQQGYPPIPIGRGRAR